MRRSEAAAARALALDPTQALAVSSQGQNATEIDRIKALGLLERAAAMAPDDAGILMWAGDELYTTGAYLDEALPLLERAYRLDPLSGINNGVLGIVYLANGQRELGYQHIRRANELGWPHATTSMALDLLWRGEIEAAIEADRAYWPANEADWTDENKLAWDIEKRVLRGEVTAAELAELGESAGFDDLVGWAVFYYHVLGDYDRMFDTWLAIEADYKFLFREVFIPGGRIVMEHPRMIEVAEKQKLFPVWEKKGYPFGCERVQDAIGDHLSCPNWPE